MLPQDVWVCLIVFVVLLRAKDFYLCMYRHLVLYYRSTQIWYTNTQGHKHMYRYPKGGNPWLLQGTDHMCDSILTREARLPIYLTFQIHEMVRNKRCHSNSRKSGIQATPPMSDV